MRVTPPPSSVPRLNVTNSRIDVAVADFEHRLLAVEFLVLRRRADRRELPDAVFAADARRTFDDDVRTDPGVVADFDAGTDHAVGAYADVGPEAYRRVDYRGRVDHQSLRSAQSSSASATTLPLTRA